MKLTDFLSNRSSIKQWVIPFLLLLLQAIPDHVHAESSGMSHANGNLQSIGLSDLALVRPLLACQDLNDHALKNELTNAVGDKTHIVSASLVEHDGASYCEVITEIEPHIKSMFKLPINGWSQRYLQTGCGGLCGVLDIHEIHSKGCVPSDTHTLALGSTDMGHQGSHMGDSSFGDDPQARIDFAYRGVHLTAVLGQKLVNIFYGSNAKYRYFSGCSDGGREALIEAQRFPNDFDAIAAGAPAMNFVTQNSFYHAWQATSNTDANGKTILTSDKLPILHKAVIAACDGLDGKLDGIIDDPRACKFDPMVIQCQAGTTDTSQCLTKDQVLAVKKLYAGPQDVNGKHLTIGGPQFGSELSWDGVFVTQNKNQIPPSTFMALGSVKKLLFTQNPEDNYTLKDFAFTHEQFDAVTTLHDLYDSTNPDLKAFADKGGKLIIWHGWSDPHISPINSIAYFDSIGAYLGKKSRDEFVKLFLIPGMYHCGDGDGPSEFDLLTTLMAWRESNEAPKQIVLNRDDSVRAKHAPHLSENVKSNKELIQSRVVFPFPNRAIYSGAGDFNDINHYHPSLDVDEPVVYDWYGRKFMEPVKR
jgi:feruloyl esterase